MFPKLLFIVNIIIFVILYNWQYVSLQVAISALASTVLIPQIEVNKNNIIIVSKSIEVPQYPTDCMEERLHSRNARSAASPTFRIIKASST